MRRCLDSTFLTEIVRGRSDAIAAAQAWALPGDRSFTTAINEFEVLVGIAREASVRRRTQLEKTWRLFWGSLDCLPVSHESAGLAAIRQAELLETGRPAPLADLLVAATAATNHCDVIVTNDEIFSRIGLVRPVPH